MEIRPFRACAMHPAIIIGTVRSLIGRWLWGRCHVPQNAFIVQFIFRSVSFSLWLVYKPCKYFLPHINKYHEINDLLQQQSNGIITHKQ